MERRDGEEGEKHLALQGKGRGRGQTRANTGNYAPAENSARRTMLGDVSGISAVKNEPRGPGTTGR